MLSHTELTQTQKSDSNKPVCSFRIIVNNDKEQFTWTLHAHSGS